MDLSMVSSVGLKFQSLVSSPLPFLQGDATTCQDFRGQCKSLYDICKVSRPSKTPDPLPKLTIENFDDEQIWGQIELLNKKEAVVCMKAASVLLEESEAIALADVNDVPEEHGLEENSSDIEIEDLSEELISNEEGSESGGDFLFENDDEENEGDGELDETQTEENFERTEVDDEFFSLRQMEKFLEEEDRKFENESKTPKESDIDYFGDIASSDDEIISDNDKVISSRNLKYSDFFAPIPASNPLNDANDKLSNVIEPDTESEKTEAEQSAFENHRTRISKDIEILEQKSLAPADWKMKGEVKASSRPENSLLQETLQFDHIARPPAEITEEHTGKLEDLIKQRIHDQAYDDVERKYKPKGNAEYKKRIVLDSSQSKLTLSEIYEKEYIEKTQISGKKNEDEKETEEHVEIRKDMEQLFLKLDSLSNFHFMASPPEPEIKLIPNVPSLAAEDVQPVTHSELQVLAPEEVFDKSIRDEKATDERSSTDKKRARRKKKLQMKARAKDRLEKEKKLNPESEKVKSLTAIEQLQKAAKVPGSNTTVIKDRGKPGKKLTSQSFFSNLQEVAANNRSHKMNRTG